MSKSKESRRIPVNFEPSLRTKITVLGAAAVVGIAAAKGGVYNINSYESSHPAEAPAAAQADIPTMVAPDKDSVHKTLKLGEAFEVDGKKVVINSLWEAANTAYPDDPNVAAGALAMLEGELPEGVSPDNVPAGFDLDLPDTAAIGHEYNPE